MEYQQYNDILEQSKQQIEAENNFKEIKYDLAESVAGGKAFNGKVGAFEKYRIFESNELQGFLEIFRSADLDYLKIYTSPINR